MFEKQQEGHCGKRGNATEDEDLEVPGGGGESTGLSGLWLLRSVKGHASPRLSLKNAVKWRAQITIIPYDAIPINLATHKTIPYPVLKVLKVQTKPWELGWEVKNQESQGGLVLSIQAVITNTTDWGGLWTTEISFLTVGGWDSQDGDTSRLFAEDLLPRGHLLAACPYVVEKIRISLGTFIYLFIYWGEPDSSA